MSIYLKQALSILNNIKSDAPEIKEAQGLFNNLDKRGGLLDDPALTNAITLLTPFWMSYKINQVLKLLKEVEKENKYKGPSGEKSKYNI